MHQPENDPRFSLYYKYEVHPFEAPPELKGGRSEAPVAIVGAGPIGLLTAIDLARVGVRSILLEAELQVSHGSRALALTRRTMEILQHSGVAEPFIAKGLPWANGRSFFRGREVYRMVMPHDEDDRFMPALNVGQQYIEEFLVDAAEATGLIDIRWGSKVTGCEQTDSKVTLQVDTPEGEYELTTDWVVAADGGRSTIRRLLNLRMDGRSYDGNFVIADIKVDIPFPTERLCFFEPDWNPGNNVLMHRHTDGMWRIDFRLPDGETPEQALGTERLANRIDLVLDMVGQKLPWELDWATVYSASTLTLPDYVVGRVAFAGDAAHLLPIFGVRGANTGFQDCDNLSWKLAAVIRGEADKGLLKSYSSERVRAAREICDEAGKSTRFMTPPTVGHRIMRDAVLSLTLTEAFPKDMLHWRTSRPHLYETSPLNSFANEDAAFARGFRTGEVIRNIRLGDDDYLFDHLCQPGFHLLCFVGVDGVLTETTGLLRAAARAKTKVNRVVVLADPSVGLGQLDADVILSDPGRKIVEKFGASAGAAYLVRPDQHVCARWKTAGARDFETALATALGRPQ
jgi:3-(3-hydroxy-phenyl)propionate hydroxylase